jgi:hypothetical protein
MNGKFTVIVPSPLGRATFSRELNRTATRYTAKRNQEWLGKPQATLMLRNAANISQTINVFTRIGISVLSANVWAKTAMVHVPGP